MVTSVWRLVFCRALGSPQGSLLWKAVDVSGWFGGSGVCKPARNAAVGAMAAFFLAIVHWASRHWLISYMTTDNYYA